MKPLILKHFGVAALLVLCWVSARGAPFAERVPFTQPDGTQIVLWGQGDEFYAVFETLDGYTVIFNPQTKAYDYAGLSADGEQLISTGVTVGQGDPAALGLKPHVRIKPEAVKKQAAERFAIWDQALEVTRRWKDLKNERQLAELAAETGGEPKSPPSSTTTGQRLGLTLLIDFSDAVATIGQAEIINFCNSDSYTGYGNNGSVKKYYQDVSNNLLTYSNVVTIYVRAPQPKSYYNITTNLCGTQGRLLINEVVAVMKALTNYTTDILPTFTNLTVDASSRVVAFNVFFAGGNSGVWNYGLWPHSSSLGTSGTIDLGNGKKLYRYQITNIGSSLTLGTFCHENGHMLCGFPDIYDYEYDSIGGAGKFCLMNSGGSGGNPSQVCAYLKRAAGWATTVALTSSSLLTASVSASGTNFNRFYRYAKPGVATEYFLVENRQKSGRDAGLPAAGIAMWHIDELGNKNYQNTNFNTTHTNYEVSLMQADNLWHFQNDVNSGDSKDLYYLGNTAAGYSNRFNDQTSPSARWWDGSASGLMLHHFSASGTTMTFGVGAEEPVIVVDSGELTMEGCMPTNGAIDPSETVTVNLSLKNVGGANTTSLVATLLATNGVNLPSGSQTYGVLVTNGAAVAQPFTFTASGDCGGVLAAVLHLRDAARNLGTITNHFILGAPGGSPVAANYSSGGVAVTIPDNTTVEVPLPISDLGTITDVNALVRLNHTYDSELALSLVHPDGTVIALANNRGGSANNFGSGASSCLGTFTVFDDDATNAIGSGTAPFAGSYKPEELLSTLNGKAVNGTWKLRVTDNAATDTGTIYCFQLDIARLLHACCTASSDLAVTLTASPDPVLAGQDLTYTLTVTNLGPEPAAGVTLTDTLPASVTFVSASPGCVNLPGKVVATVGTLSSGGDTNFTVVVTPTVGGLITNTLTVATFTSDPDSANNSATNVTAVYAPATIAVQPTSQAVIVGSNVTFQVTAVGTAPLSYQWRLDGTNLLEAVSSALTLTNAQMAQAGSYSVLVTNDFGAVLSSNALLTVLDPWIIGQPQNQTVAEGTPATFTVSAIGTPPLSYQWYKAGIPLADGTNITGALTATLTLAQVQAGDMSTYSVAVSNLYGQVVSSNAILSANLSPFVVIQPANQTVTAGSVASFTATVTGTAPISYQWRRAGINLADGGKFSGVTNASLIVSNAQATEMDSYSLVAGNAYGSVTSSNAFLRLWPLVAWGRSNYDQTSIPGGLESVKAVTAGLYHGLALRTDGAVAAWGAGTNNTGVSPQLGQAIVPAGLSNVVQVSGGYYHNLALKTDGTVAAWGAGTTNTGATPHYGQAIVPGGLTNVAAVAGGGYHSLALALDGTVAAWGAGTTNTGVSPHYGQAIVPGDLSNVVAVAGGGYHSLALKSDSTVVAWGAGTTNTGVSPHYGQAIVPAGLGNLVMVAAGGFHNLALKSDGTVVAWGDNSYGQTNIPAGLTNVVAITAGRYYNLALQSDGTLVGWGDNTYGQTNVPAGVVNVVGMAGGGFHTIAQEGDGRPVITVQPLSQAVPAGANVRLLALAVGPPPLTCQWQRNGTNLPGATSNSLDLGLQCTDAGTYTVVFSNQFGSTLSSPATLTISDSVPPTISCPADVTISANAGCGATNVVLGNPVVDDNCGVAAVTNDAPASYVLGTNVVTWTVADTGGNTNSCQQRVIVLDSIPPTIACPTNLVVFAASGLCSASNVTWEIAASDNCAVTSLVSEPPSGSTFPAGMTTVRCTATDAAGNTNACEFTVTVVVPPFIQAPPISQAVPVGQEVTFCVTATNDCDSQVTYQWRFQGAEISGATTNCFVVATARPTNTGNYDVVLTNLAGSVTSPVAVLTVVGPYLTVWPVEPPQSAGGRTNFIFTFPTVTGVDYVVQYMDVLMDTNDWLPLLTNPGTGGLITNDFPITGDPPSRFYRVMIP